MAINDAYDADVLNDVERQHYDALDDIGKARFIGVGYQGRKLYDCPKYDVTQDDKVIQNGNSFIVLGYDRPHSRASGFGATGNKCSSMDIVVGRLGYQARSHTPLGKEKIVSPNFKKDAARIYISQRAAVDDIKYFGLAKGTVGNVKMGAPRSTIALKADTLRFIARENIKFVTKTDKKNSQGGKLANAWQGQYGIDLIAMNDDSDMQPMVKGNNLRECLSEMMDHINELRDKLVTVLDYQRNLTQTLLTHTHRTMFYGLTSAPDFEQLMPKGIESMLNTAMNVEIPAMSDDLMKSTEIVKNYLCAPGGMRHRKYILSKYNNTN
jgi:hypothetical protein